MTDPILEAAENYGESRRVQLTLRRKFAAYRCEFADEEVPRCYHGVVGADSCPPCQQREPVFQEWKAARAAEKTALRHLQRALVRRQEGRI